MAAAAADGGEGGREGLEVFVCCVVWVLALSLAGRTSTHLKIIPGAPAEIT